MSHYMVSSLLCTALMFFGETYAANQLSNRQASATKVEAKPSQSASKGAQKEFQAKDYQRLIGMKGFTDKLLTLHFKLYEGYVKNANALSQKLRDLANDGKDKSPEFAGLKRMYGWEFDGMRLHELYFDNLGGSGKNSLDNGLAHALQAQFGSYDRWKEDFVATGMMRGIGWAVLYYDGETGRLTNTWLNEHDLGHLAGNAPILVMDVFEHAYMPEYGLERAQYIQAFFNNIDWELVSARFDRAVAQSVQQ